jgi:hypothetical protein
MSLDPSAGSDPGIPLPRSYGTRRRDRRYRALREELRRIVRCGLESRQGISLVISGEAAMIPKLLEFLVVRADLHGYSNMEIEIELHGEQGYRIDIRGSEELQRFVQTELIRA